MRPMTGASPVCHSVCCGLCAVLLSQVCFKSCVLQTIPISAPQGIAQVPTWFVSCAWTCTARLPVVSLSFSDILVVLLCITNTVTTVTHTYVSSLIVLHGQLMTLCLLGHDEGLAAKPSALKTAHCKPRQCHTVGDGLLCRLLGVMPSLYLFIARNVAYHAMSNEFCRVCRGVGQFHHMNVWF